MNLKPQRSFRDRNEEKHAVLSPYCARCHAQPLQVRVVLHCPVEGKNQMKRTSLGLHADENSYYTAHDTTLTELRRQTFTKLDRAPRAAMKTQNSKTPLVCYGDIRRRGADEAQRLQTPHTILGKETPGDHFKLLYETSEKR